MDVSAQLETDLIAQIESENEEYCQLRSRHFDYQKKLEALSGKRALTEAEKNEEIRIKKEKLFLKDRMAAIRREYLASRKT